MAIAVVVPMVSAVIYMGSDHRGLRLKSVLKDYLSGRGYDIMDMGPFSYDKDDNFLDYADVVCREALKSNGLGILVCGSGQGMSMAANKVRGIRATLCWNEESGRLAKEHHDANVICLAGQIGSEDDAKLAVDAWLGSRFTGEERHARRIGRLNEM